MQFGSEHVALRAETIRSIPNHPSETIRNLKPKADLTPGLKCASWTVMGYHILIVDAVGLAHQEAGEIQGTLGCEAQPQ